MYGLDGRTQLLGPNATPYRWKSCVDKGPSGAVSTLIAQAGFNIDTVEIHRTVGEGLVGIRFSLNGPGDLQSLLTQLAEQDSVVEVLPYRRPDRASEGTGQTKIA